MEKQTKNSYELLLNEKIITNLLGKREFGWSEHDENFMMHMPLMDIDELNSISSSLGLKDKYAEPSLYLSELIKHCIKNERVSDLLSYFFDKSRFINLLSCQYYTIEQSDSIYGEIIWHSIYEINFILNFYNKKLVNSGGKYDIIPISNITVDTPKIKTINRDYILSIYQKAINDISDGNYDECLTKSRTLLEEVFCKVIEDKGEIPKAKGNINQLYKQVKDLYNMHGDKDMDVRINTLISGLENIVNSVAEMRNKASDAHGIGAKRYNILDYHARLALNSALTMAEFVYSVAEKNNKK